MKTMIHINKYNNDIDKNNIDNDIEINTDYNDTKSTDYNYA